MKTALVEFKECSIIDYQAYNLLDDRFLNLTLPNLL